VGAQLKAGASREALVLGASFLSKDTDLVLGLLGDMLMRPQLDSAEFDKARELAVQSIAAAKDSDPSALIGDYGVAWLFGEHAHARPDGGDPASLEAIRLDDVKRYYMEQMGGDRLLIAVVGDIDKAVLQRKLETALGSWRKAAGTLPSVATPIPTHGRRVLLVGPARRSRISGSASAHRAIRRTAQSVVNTARRSVHVDAQYGAASRVA
jgi:predicted Zn-dependent peptidase